MRDQAQDMLAQLEAGWLGMQWRAIAPQVWVGFAISVVAAWLLWDEGAVWFACAVGTGVMGYLVDSSSHYILGVGVPALVASTIVL